jgi:hypothetical protein
MKRYVFLCHTPLTAPNKHAKHANIQSILQAVGGNVYNFLTREWIGEQKDRFEKTNLSSPWMEFIFSSHTTDRIFKVAPNVYWDKSKTFYLIANMLYVKNVGFFYCTRTPTADGGVHVTGFHSDEYRLQVAKTSSRLKDHHFLTNANVPI